MAEILSILHFRQKNRPVFTDDDDLSSFETLPFIPDPTIRPDRHNQVNFVMDLFHQRVEESNLINHDFDLTELTELTELRDSVVSGGGGGDDCGGLTVVGVDSESESKSELESEFDGGVGDLLGIRVESEEEDENVEDDDDFGVGNDDDDDDDLSNPLCWDSFRLDYDNDNDNDNDNNGGVIHDFEWEEVNDDDDDDGWPSLEEVQEMRAREIRDLEWQVLMNRMDYGNEIDQFFGDDNDDDSTYELLFGQFSESEGAFLTRPPTSKTVVNNLLSVITTEFDVVNEKAGCAVCKDQIEVGEVGKQLPCLHRYHGDCILPWLEIRNTCPVCRYELKTDDVEYEERRGRRAARAV